MILKVKKLSLDAILPTYARSGDAGMDLYVNETVTLLPGKTIKLHSGIAVEIPEGFVGLCWDKSGLSINYGIKVLGHRLRLSWRNYAWSYKSWFQAVHI